MPTFVTYKKSSIYLEGVKHEYSHPTRVSSNRQYFFLLLLLFADSPQKNTATYHTIIIPPCDYVSA